MKKILTVLLSLILVLAMSATAFAAGITASQAQKKALKNAGLSKSQVRAMEVELDDEDGNYDIEFVKKSNKAEYEYEIDGDTGKILEKKIEYRHKRNTSSKKIGKAAARKKAAKFTGISLSVIKKGTCVYDYDFDDDDGDDEGTYDIKFKKGGYRYELEILAPTGKVIEYSKKAIKR